MTPKGLLACFVILFASGGGTTIKESYRFESVKGTVRKTISGCDYFLVETVHGFDVLEWYGGHDPDEDDVLVGEYETYGFHDVVVTNRSTKMRVYTEDYQLSKSSALEKLVDECH